MAAAAEHPQSPRNKVSLGTAKAIPVLLALIVAYCSYVVVGPLSIDYLINNDKSDRKPRVAAGIAIPIVWFALLIPVAATWVRLLTIVFGDPGYIPQGYGKDDHLDTPDGTQDIPDDFWTRDVFVCDQKGQPIYCYHCRNWKPDRAHHNQDVGRCTTKMDHFCPWVGGVVGERSHKFFFQFLFYSTLLSTYLMICLAYFVHETRSNVHWLVALGIAGFFVLFTLGMVVNTLNLLFHNTTTIESINGASRTMLLAVLLPPELQPHLRQAEIVRPPTAATLSTSRSDATRFEADDVPLTSEIDDPSHANYFSNHHVTRTLKHASRAQGLGAESIPTLDAQSPQQTKYWRGTITYPLNLPTDRPPLPAPQPRTFAILETPPGMNPWDLGSPWRNFTAVMGPKLHHWLLPIGRSPCCDHSSRVSWYPLGPQFEDFLFEAGLVQEQPHSSTQSARGPPSDYTKSHADDRKRRKRRLADGWQNGERPDGWLSEKEARRARNDRRRMARMEEGREGMV